MVNIIYIQYSYFHSLEEKEIHSITFSPKGAFTLYHVTCSLITHILQIARWVNIWENDLHEFLILISICVSNCQELWRSIKEILLPSLPETLCMEIIQIIYHHVCYFHISCILGCWEQNVFANGKECAEYRWFLLLLLLWHHSFCPKVAQHE